MMKLLLLEVCAFGDEVDFVSTWHRCMDTDLVLALDSRPGRHNGLLIVLNEKDGGAEKLADWIEEAHSVTHYNELPLFVIWEGDGVVHKYAPFENGVRQLINTHEPVGVHYPGDVQRPKKVCQACRECNMVHCAHPEDCGQL